MSLQQPNLTALAKQGDLNAIAALMNRALQPRGIIVKVAHQNGHLRVLLEGQTVPDQTILAPYIRKGIVALQIPELHTLDVVGRLKGTNIAVWSETFALTVAGAEISTTPSTQPEPAKQVHEQPVENSARDNVTTTQESHSASNPEVPSSADLDAIAAHLNQAMGTETLEFEVALSDCTLKLTAKTNQILEGDTFAKTVQTLLLPLNLPDIDLVQLFKQKTRGNNPYKIKEFVLYKEPAPTETDADNPPSPSQVDRPMAQYQPTRSQPTLQPKPTSPASSQAASKSKLVMIGVVALFVVLFIGAIKFVAAPPAATEVCQEATGAPGYCQLAVQIMGEQTMHDLKTAVTPFTPEMEEKGLSICADITDLQRQRKFAQQKTRYSASIQIEPIFPGIMIVDTQLKTSAQAAMPTFRTACLLAGDENQVDLLKNVVLPNGWPQEPYQGKQEWEPMQRSLKVYQILIMLGGGTLFTAIGLFAASALNFGFQIYTFRGLFQTASILGALDTLLLVLSGSKLNLFGGIPLTCLALGLTQLWVKDLRVDWASGYRSVALGVFVMMVIRFVLNWLLLGFIFSVL